MTAQALLDRLVRVDPSHRLGLTADELAAAGLTGLWHHDMADLAPHVVQADVSSPVASDLLPPMHVSVRDVEGAAVATGWTVAPDGSARVHVRTPLPGVTPAMVDWWFGWHGDDPARYKLWHPRAHVHARWHVEPPAGSTGRARYVGHTSVVEEYVGAAVGRFAIQFREPVELGIVDPRLDDPAVATAVCARIGLDTTPLDAGWLAHLVVAEPDGSGSVMHSRFWLGGPYVGADRAGRLGPLATRAGRVVRPTAGQARELMVHCAQEMAHLPRFLPQAHARFS